jgi:hypothetical protein
MTLQKTSRSPPYPNQLVLQYGYPKASGQETELCQTFALNAGLANGGVRV